MAVILYSSWEEAAEHYSIITAEEFTRLSAILQPGESIENRIIDKLVVDRKNPIRIRNCFIREISFTTRTRQVSINIENTTIADPLYPFHDTEPGKQISADENFLMTFEESITIRNCLFLGPVYWKREKGCCFREKCDLSYNTYQAELDAGHSEFYGRADFSRSTYRTRCSFAGNTYLAEADFQKSACHDFACYSNSHYGAEATFSYSVFNNGSFFNQSDYTGDVKFRMSTFKRAANFDNSIYRGRVDFGLCRFLAGSNFHNSIYQAEFQIRKSTFQLGTNLGHSRYKGPADFSDCCFERRADFQAADFEQKTLFHAAVFKTGALFTGSCFTGGTCFSNCTFTGIINLDHSLFRGLLYFAKNNFQDLVSLVSCRFQAALEFETNKHPADLDLQQSQFAAPLRFSGNNNFQGRVLFSGSRLQAGITVNGCLNLETGSLLCFSNAVIEGEVFFGEERRIYEKRKKTAGENADRHMTIFAGEADFLNTVFEDKVLFDGCCFPGTGKISFYNTQFKDKVYFDECNLSKDIDFTTCYVATEITFVNARFSGDIHVRFEDSVISSRLNFARTRFSGNTKLSFADSVPNYLAISREQLNYRGRDRTRLLYQGLFEGYFRATPEMEQDLLEAEDLSIQTGSCLKKLAVRTAALKRLITDLVLLKKNFSERNMHSEEDWIYYLLMHYKNNYEFYRKKLEFSRSKGNHTGKETSRGTLLTAVFKIPSLLKKLIFEKAFGWGVRLSHIGITTIIIISLFAAVYLLIGLFNPTSIEINGTVKSMAELSLFECIYLSTQALSNVILGDWIPVSSNPLVKSLMTVEAVIGILLITFLVGAYARKLLR